MGVQLMIIAIFQGPINWFVALIELVSVIAAILLIGLIIGMTGFWMLGRFVRKLAGAPAELEPEDELDEDGAEKIVSIQRDHDDSPPL
jgi:hypothetical protein